METRETEARIATPAPATNIYTNPIAADVNTCNNVHNAAANYSMSTLGLIPGSAWPGSAPQPSLDTSRECVGDANTDRGRDAGSGTPLSWNEKAFSVSHESLPQPQPQPQTPYVPQFSAATSLILNRIKGGDKSDFNTALSAASATISRPDRDTFEEAKMRLMKQMNATRSSLPTPEPSTSSQSQSQTQTQPRTQSQPPAVPVQEETSEEVIQKGIKRKREANDEEEGTAEKPIDFTQNTIPFPIPVQQGRPSGMSAATSGVDVRCVKCGVSSSISSNVLVACTGCSTVCHQACLAPSPATEQVPEVSSQSILSCPRCGAASTGEPLNDVHVQPEPLRRKQKIERIRQVRLAALPEGVSPAKPELVGFGPGAASDRARADYFNNMTKTDVLNLLSFCDQLRPQLLVDIMVSVSKRHPDLLIFNSPDWNGNESRSTVADSSSKAAHASRKAHLPSGRPPHGRSLLNSKAKQKIKSGSIAKQSSIKRPAKRSQLAGETVEAAAGMQGEGDIDDDAPPPTWPKAGEGLYAKLASEINDRLFLADENDEEAFSHFMVDKMGRQIIDPV